MHVDGFRFDLAATLAREEHAVDRFGAFFDVIQQDPVLNAGQADRRAVGPRRRRLPGRQLPAGLGRMERQVPRRRCAPTGKATAAWSASSRCAAVRLERSLRAQRARPDARASTSSPRTTASRCTTSSATTRSTTRRTARTTATASRHNRSWNCGVEGPDRRSRDQGAARAAEAQLPRHAALLAGRAHAARRRRAGTHAGRQQQRLLPGQRGVAGSTGSSPRKRASSWNSPRRLIALRNAHPLFRRRTFFRGRAVRRSRHQGPDVARSRAARR